MKKIFIGYDSLGKAVEVKEAIADFIHNNDPDVDYDCKCGHNVAHCNCSPWEIAVTRTWSDPASRSSWTVTKENTGSVISEMITTVVYN